MTILFTNNASSTLASGITNVATSLTVASGQGALFPTPSGASFFYATLENTAATIREIVKVTARTTNTFTIVRGQDGTAAQTWATGDKVQLRVTAADLNNFGQLDTANTWASGQIFVAPVLGTPASGNFSSGTFTWPTFNQNTTGTAASLSATLSASLGGTGIAGTLTGISYMNGASAHTVATTAQLLSGIGTLPIANGGTNSTATPTAGGIGYGTGTAHAYTAAGTAGQVLTSNGAAAPTWQAAAGGGGLGGTQVFTASGTFTIPTGVTKVKVTVVGAGGGGGGGNGCAPYSGAGGSGGGTAVKYLSGLTPGNTLTVTRGAGGTAGAYGGNGSTGGTSSVASGTQIITTISATGGGGGNFGGGNGAYTTSPGVGSSGDLNLQGSAGENGISAPSPGVQGGAAGGASYLGGAGAGAVPYSISSTANGSPGVNGGGGGGSNALGNSGGAGGNGVVIFEW